MASLIDSIISLEKEADRIVNDAQERSKIIHRSSEDELARYRNELIADLEVKLARFKEETQRRFDQSLADASRTHDERLRALREISEEFTIRQVNRILDRFSNW